VGLVSWRRTRTLRRGSIPQARDPPASASFSSSRTTLLAALAGICAAAWGGAIALRGGGAALDLRLFQAVPLIGIGLFVGISGSVARVTGFRLGQEKLVVHFAGRPARSVDWSSLVGLRPPATPFGGWSLTDARGSTWSLMPSDLFGHEEILELIVVRARLTFDGRAWIRSRQGVDPSFSVRGISPPTE
jgi:hypothetical protein